MNLNQNRGRRTQPIAEINVVPYIDVMLVLLVIFMITAPILSQGITVDLPKVASEQVPTADREPIIVSVNQQGQLFLNVSDSPQLPIEPSALQLRVAAELGLAKQNNQKVNVLVKGDAGVPYGQVVAAMGLLKHAGAEQVGLMTDESQNSESS
jgi:biopolymer transport protein TolR